MDGIVTHVMIDPFTVMLYELLIYDLAKKKSFQVDVCVSGGTALQIEEKIQTQAFATIVERSECANGGKCNNMFSQFSLLVPILHSFHMCGKVLSRTTFVSIFYSPCEH